jgi:hypothetical protein
MIKEIVYNGTAQTHMVSRFGYFDYTFTQTDIQIYSEVKIILLLFWYS